MFVVMCGFLGCLELSMMDLGVIFLVFLRN